MTPTVCSETDAKQRGCPFSTVFLLTRDAGSKGVVARGGEFFDTNGALPRLKMHGLALAQP